MTSTARINELLRILQERGYWTLSEVGEVTRLTEEPTMGRDAGYIPEGTEDWMQEDGVPRAYDKPKRGLGIRLDNVELTEEERRGPVVTMGITEAEAEALLKTPGKVDLSPPPLRPGEPAELVKAGKVVGTPLAPTDIDARLKTMEAALTDAFRRIKALEERVVDPSV